MKNASPILALTSNLFEVIYKSAITRGRLTASFALIAVVSLSIYSATSASTGSRVVAPYEPEVEVRTDKPVYVPGETVVITGTGWKPWERVWLVIHEEPATVKRDRSFLVLADMEGSFKYTDFAAEERNYKVTYTVTATGEASGRIARATFALGKIRVKAAPAMVTFTLQWAEFVSTSCMGEEIERSESKEVDGITGASFISRDTNDDGDPNSLSFEAAPFSDQGGEFLGWASPLPNRGPFTVDPDNPRRICVPGYNGEGLREYYANYAPAGTPPTIECPNNVSVSSSPGECSAVVSYTVTATGEPSPDVTCQPPSGSIFPVGVTTVNCSATNGSGSASCSFTVTVSDTEAPSSITCPSPSSAPVGPNCQSAIPDVTGGVSATDNCTPAGALTVTQSPAAGTIVSTGVHTITITVGDAANNMATCTTTYTVIEDVPPTITCPAGTTAAANADCQAAVPDVTTGVTASDNCTPAGSLVITQSPAAGTLVGIGTETITVTVRDAANNTATCTTSFTVLDSTAPAFIVCPPGSSAPANESCQAAIPNVVPSATVVDNCSPAGSITITQSPAAGTLVGTGVHPITVTARDAANNTATCTVDFTVVDSSLPTINCPGNIVTSTMPGQCSALVMFSVTASDNCSPAPVVCLPASGSVFPKGVTPVSCVATDAGGNQATCNFTVTVNDTEPPAISCPNNIVVRSKKAGASSVIVTYVDPTTSDNCAGVSVTCKPPSGSAFPVGTTTVSCTATDASSNSAFCTFTVSVIDACLQDDSNSGFVLLFSSATGDYVFCCGTEVYTGTGVVTRSGSVLTLEHVTDTRRLIARIDNSNDRGSASLQVPIGREVCNIEDRDITNNTCVCMSSTR